MADHLPSGDVRKLVILRDCMSPVAGFDAQEREFLAAIAARGATVTTSAEFLGARG